MKKRAHPLFNCPAMQSIWQHYLALRWDDYHFESEYDEILNELLKYKTLQRDKLF